MVMGGEEVVVILVMISEDFFLGRDILVEI